VRQQPDLDRLRTDLQVGPWGGGAEGGGCGWCCVGKKGGEGRLVGSRRWAQVLCCSAAPLRCVCLTTSLSAVALVLCHFMYSWQYPQHP